MKKILLLVLTFTMSMGLYAQRGAVEMFFNKYKDNDNFTSVYISKSMFGTMLKNKGGNNKPDILNSLNGLDILTTEKKARSFFNEAKSTLFSNGYEELMRVNDQGTNVLFMVKDSDGTTAKELVFLILDDKQAVMMSFTGNIPLDKISELGNTVNFGGKQYFNSANKR